MKIEDNTEETFIIYPAVDADTVTTYERWKILVWSYVSQHDWILGFLWATFCVSFEQIKIEEMIGLFKYAGSFF